jgi:hypothetical protein
LNRKRLAVMQQHGGFRFARRSTDFVFATELHELNVIGSGQRQPRAQVDQNLSRQTNQRLRG